MQWAEIEFFLLETVLGIIVLGAVGSLVGITVLSVARWIAKYYMEEMALEHAMRLLYPYAKEIEMARECKAELSRLDDNQAYHYRLMEAMISTYLSIALCTIFFPAATVAFVLLWPDYPLLVALLIGLSLLLVHGTIKAAFFYFTFRPGRLDEIEKKVSNRYRTFEAFKATLDRKEDTSNPGD